MNLNLIAKASLIAGFLLSLNFGSPTHVSAQTVTGVKGVQNSMQISGIVVDAQGEPVIGANITEVKDGTNGTISDFDGKFTLTVASNSTLRVSFIGYQTKQVNVTPGNSFYKIVLKEDTETLDEVVVVGYGVMRKSDLTGSVGKMDINELKKVSTVDAAQAMQGRMAGVNVISNSGNPGSGATIRIRGIGTFNNSDPLYIVDGFPVNDISHISPTDIESMEVLKDASATAIYGSRGANGVILVKTKAGTVNKGSVEVQANAYMGISHVANKLELADATQFSNAYRSLIGGDDASFASAYPHVQSVLDQNASGTYVKGTDWQKEISRPALSQRYNVSIQGSGENYNYSHGITYSDEQGIIKGSELQKIIFHSNNNYNVSKKVKLGVNLNYVWYEKPGDGNSDYYNGTLPGALRSDPI